MTDAPDVRLGIAAGKTLGSNVCALTKKKCFAVNPYLIGAIEEGEELPFRHELTEFLPLLPAKTVIF